MRVCSASGTRNKAIKAMSGLNREHISTIKSWFEKKNTKQLIRILAGVWAKTARKGRGDFLLSLFLFKT